VPALQEDNVGRCIRLHKHLDGTVRRCVMTTAEHREDRTHRFEAVDGSTVCVTPPVRVPR